MQIEAVKLSAIETRKTRHEPTELALLAESIRALGLLHYPVLRKNGRKFEIVAGAGRVAACRKLKLEAVPAAIITCDDLHAELARIDENLVRWPLGTAQADAELARRKVLYEQLHPETRHRTKRGGPGRGKKTTPETGVVISSFSQDTAAKTGKAPSTVRAAVSRAERTAPEVWKAYEKEKVTATQVDELVKLDPDTQRQVLPEVVGKGVAETKAAVKAARIAARGDQRFMRELISALKSIESHASKAGSEAEWLCQRLSERPDLELGGVGISTTLISINTAISQLSGLVETLQ